MTSGNIGANTVCKPRFIATFGRITVQRFQIPCLKLNKFRYFCNKSNRENDVVILKKRGPISLIGINRPAKKNALNYDTALGIEKALTAVEQDGTTKAAVLYGERGNLCCGYDLDELDSDPSMIEKIKELDLTGRFSKIPLVAAVSGYTQGCGFELALWCDFRVVEESAVLGGFAKQLGMPMSQQSANKFVSILGLNKALDWILTGRTVNGKEAWECGIANRLVAVGTGLGQAYSFACGLANMPEACLKADRAAIYLASQKHSEKSISVIMDQRDTMVIAALQDFNSKKYRNVEDGDVRKRSDKSTS